MKRYPCDRIAPVAWLELKTCERATLGPPKLRERLQDVGGEKPWPSNGVSFRQHLSAWRLLELCVLPRALCHFDSIQTSTRRFLASPGSLTSLAAEGLQATGAR